MATAPSQDNRLRCPTCGQTEFVRVHQALCEHGHKWVFLNCFACDWTSEAERLPCTHKKGYVYSPEPVMNIEGKT